METSKLLQKAEEHLRQARRNIGAAWRLIEDAKLALAKSKPREKSQ